MVEDQLKFEQYEKYVDKIQKKYHVPGIAVGLNKKGENIYQKGIGFRNIDKGLEVTKDTIFGIASVTKSFTCMGIMQLQEKEKLSVHDQVVKYLPEFQLPDEPHLTDQVTIHHFMTHTSGLPPLSSISFALMRTMDKDPSADDYPGLKLNDKEGLAIDTFEQLMQFIGETNVTLLGKPGEEFSYSNDCYALLGAIIERVSNQTYESFISENILQPAGMKNSTFYLEEVKKSSDVTEQYSVKTVDGKEEVYAAPVWWDARAMRGAGFLRSTMGDMLKYAEIFINDGVIDGNQILSSKSIEEMMKPYVKIDQTKYYGYGLMITPDFHGVKLVEHGGSLKAISSQLSMIPEKGLGGIVLTNLVGVPAFQIMNGAMNLALGLSVDTPYAYYPDYTCSKEIFTQYVGEYASEEGANIQISVEDDQLVFIQENKVFPLRAVGKHRFTVKLKEAETPIRFVFNEKGSVRALAMGVRQIPKK